MDCNGPVCHSRPRHDGSVTRIVAGVAGGRRLAVPPRGTRPTSERVREAVFSAVQARRDLEGARVLDLYAGSGALGLEALSRGAAHVRFVESDRRAVAVLRRNIETLGLGGPEGVAAQVSVASVAAVLSAVPGEPYDVVLADPPYALDDDTVSRVLAALARGGWLASGAVLVVERPARAVPPSWPDGVVALTQRRYGDTAVHYGSAI
ncbi:MAG TPA: 16S rRNA (guanine(966)-N(2))-methyltransferase RsmD [Pseudonocardiaceae bacterium]|nr:16S rRNA (guanine(966)-N(2))-methyltransferase RsmD [Pseudonocardiaceae bacterium]